MIRIFFVDIWRTFTWMFSKRRPRRVSTKQYTNIRDLFLHRDRSRFFHYCHRAAVTRTDYVIDFHERREQRDN